MGASDEGWVWIHMIIFVPGIGCLVYFFTQVLPELSQNRTVRRAGNSLVRAVDPQHELRRRKDERDGPHRDQWTAYDSDRHTRREASVVLCRAPQPP